MDGPSSSLLLVGGEGSKNQAVSSDATTRDNDNNNVNVNVSTAIHQFASTRSLSRIENLPPEILQEIVWQALDLTLASVSPVLAKKLNYNILRRKLIFLAFFEFQLPSAIWMSYYHDAHGTDLEYGLKLDLMNHIIDQQWFSAELVFDCQREYLSRLVPSPLCNLLEDQYKVVAKPWTFPQESRDTSPWFPNLPLSSLSDQQKDLDTGNFFHAPPATKRKHRHTYDSNRFRIGYWKTSLGGTDRPYRFSWKVKGPGDIYDSLVVSVTKHGGHPELNLRLYNPGTWTEDNLAMLVILTREYEPESMTDELVEAFSAGLMAAISQKFVPAVFTRCSIHARDDQRKNLVDQISEHALERADDGDSSASTTWILKWRRKLANLEKGQIHGGRYWEKPVTSDHLIRAMEIVCDRDVAMDIASYYIFCWISINFVCKLINQGLPYPQDIRKQIRRLALSARGVYGNQCYKFFKDTLAMMR